MSDSVPKRSRLRRRATHDDAPPSTEQQTLAETNERTAASEAGPRGSSHATESIHPPRRVPEPDHVMTSEGPRPTVDRQAARSATPDVAPAAHLSHENSRQNSENRENIQSGRDERDTHDRAQSEELSPDDRQRILPTPDREEAAQKPARNMFHFRRHRDGHEQVPTTEEAPAPAPATAGTGFAAEDNNRGVRPMPRYLRYSMFDWLVQSNLLFGLGYNVTKFRRYGRFEDANPGLRLEADADGLALGMVVARLNSHGRHIVGIVKPLVKVHAVSLSTGYYIRSRNLPAVAPVTTRPCSLVDATASPTWNQELVLSGYFSDIVAEDTLLLFEVLDDKPSFRADYQTAPDTGMPIAKRVAWGYLLPIGTSGELNVGFSDEWKYASRRTAARQGRGGSPGEDHASRDNLQLETEGSAPPLESRSGSGSAKLAPTRARSHDALDTAADGIIAGGTPVPVEARVAPQRGRKPPQSDKSVRVQLYAYRQYDGLFGLMQRKIKGWPTIGSYKDNGESSYPDGVPEVYAQWRLQRRVQLQGAYLSVRLGPRPAEAMPILQSVPGGGEGMSSPAGERMVGHSQEEGIPHTLSGLYAGRRGRLWAGPHGAPQSTANLTKLRSALLKRTRGSREPCVVPDKLLQRLDVGPEGALVVSFSHSGHILAIAAKTNLPGIPLSSDSVLYSIILYDTDLKEEVWVEDAAHHGPIYDLKWSRDDRCLLSCSGDGTCKVWDMTPTSFRASNLMGFGALNAGAATGAGGIGAHHPHHHRAVSDSAALTVGSKPPSLICTMVASPPVYTYTGVFQDQPSASPVGGLQDPTGRHPDVPRVITGAADGKLRVWDGPEMAGYIAVTSRDKDGANEATDYSPHDGQINSIVIDERSRYMISGDSNGDIFAWRCDAKGWYQLLRKFKRDAAPSTGLAALAEHSTGGGVLSFTMHPDKHRGQLLALLRQPAQLKVINLSTYKTHCVCSGFSGYSAAAASTVGGFFNRAQYSADGRYAVAGSSVKAQDGLHRVQVWDASTGHVVRTPLSDMMFPYPVRSLSWHPTQHLLAVSMVGHGAAVVLYAGDRESADKATERMNSPSAAADQEPAARNAEDTLLGSEATKLRASLDRQSAKSPLGPAAATSTASPSSRGPGLGQGLGPPRVSDSLTSLEAAKPDGSDEASKLLQTDRAKEMLERIRAAKAAKQQNS